jgi:copper chaperone
MAQITVTGLSCQHCVAAVKSALEKRAGVLGINFQLADGRAVVSFDPGKVSRQEISALVEEIGYQVE